MFFHLCKAANLSRKIYYSTGLGPYGLFVLVKGVQLLKPSGSYPCIP